MALQILMAIALIKHVPGNSDLVLLEDCWLPNISFTSKLTSDKIKNSPRFQWGERNSRNHSNSKEKTKYERIRTWAEIHHQESIQSFKFPFRKKMDKFLRATFWTGFGFVLFYVFCRGKDSAVSQHHIWTRCCSKSYLPVKAQHKAYLAICTTRSTFLLLPLPPT